MMNQIPDCVPFEQKEYKESMELKEALQYINYGIKEGYVDESHLAGMDEAELIEWVNKAMGRADVLANDQDWHADYHEEERK